MDLEIIAVSSKLGQQPLRGFFRDIVNTYEVGDESSTSELIIQKSPVIKFVRLPVLFSNTLFELHPKNEELKMHYVKWRSLTILLFQYYYTKTSNKVQTAKIVSDIFIDHHDDFNDFDYFLEFLFLPMLRHLQPKLLTYILLGLLDDPKYTTLREMDNPYVGLTPEVSLHNVTINRLKFIYESPGRIFLKIREFIIGVEPNIIPHISDMDYEVVNFGHRTLGIHDKSIHTNLVRNSLQSLFVPIDEQPQLTRDFAEVTTGEDRAYVVNFFKTSISLEFDKDDDISFIYLYQFISTFFPLNLDKKKITLDRLGSWKHDMVLYDQKVGMKLNQVHEYEVVDFDSFGNKITVLNLSPTKYFTLKNNLEQIQKQLPHLFKAPTLTLDYFGFQIENDIFNELYLHYYENYDEHRGMISSTRIIQQTSIISFTILRGKETGYLQIHSKKGFFEIHKEALILPELAEKLVELSILVVIEFIQLADLGTLGDRTISELRKYINSAIGIIK